MKNFLKIILNILLPIDAFRRIDKSPFFCRHDITYYDIKLVVEDAEHHLYDKINGDVWRDHLCHCKKCGVKKRKGMKIGDFGKWLNYDFEIPKSGSVVEVEIVPFGSETKRQKRDRIIKNILESE